MDLKDEIYFHIKDLAVAPYLEDVVARSDLLPGDGAKVHERNTIRNVLVNIVKISSTREETFYDLRKRNSKAYEVAMRNLEKLVEMDPGLGLY